MKTKINLFKGITIILAFFTFSSCEYDNYDAPDSEVYGTLIDKVTGLTVPQDMGADERCRLYVVELGYKDPPTYDQMVKSDGTFINKQMFSGTYTMWPNQGNFIDPESPDTVVVNGRTEVKIYVTPYLSIRDVNYNYDESTNKVTATFRVTTNIEGKIVRKAFMYVDRSSNVSYSFSTDEANIRPGRIVKPDETLTIEYDCSKLTPNTDYFFRAGAAIGGVDGAKYNYAIAQKIHVK